MRSRSQAMKHAILFIQLSLFLAIPLLAASQVMTETIEVPAPPASHEGEVGYGGTTRSVFEEVLKRRREPSFEYLRAWFKGGTLQLAQADFQAAQYHFNYPESSRKGIGFEMAIEKPISYISGIWGVKLLSGYSRLSGKGLALGGLEISNLMTWLHIIPVMGAVTYTADFLPAQRLLPYAEMGGGYLFTIQRSEFDGGDFNGGHWLGFVATGLRFSLGARQVGDSSIQLLAEYRRTLDNNAGIKLSGNQFFGGLMFDL